MNKALKSAQRLGVKVRHAFSLFVIIAIVVLESLSTFHDLLLSSNAGEHRQRVAERAVGRERNVRVQAVAYHARARFVEAVRLFEHFPHRMVWLS